MATVRISNTLRDDIIRLASASQEKAEIRAKESRPSNDWAEKIYNTLLGEDVIALAEKVPEHWFTTVTRFSLRTIGDLDCGHMEFQLQTEKRWPRIIRSQLGRAAYAGSTDLYLSDNLLWGELYAEMSAWRARVSAAQVKKEEFLLGIRTILSNHATLAPALKAWPPLWDYLPDAVKAKHKEVSTKEKKAEVVLDVDLSTLTAMAVAAKIG